MLPTCACVVHRHCIRAQTLYVDRRRNVDRIGVASSVASFVASFKEPTMKIGIIGAGNIGGTLTRRLTKLGHEVFVANSRGPESLRDLAAETGAKAVSVEKA